MPNPIPGFTVTTPYGTRGDSWHCDRQNGLGIHTGDDYSTKGQIGFDVFATAPGKVLFATTDGGWGGDYGTHVVVDSGDLRHGYCHLSKLLVGVGDHVDAGTRVGLSGNTGNVAGSIGPFKGAHLHYEERTTPFGFCNVSRRPQLSRGPGPGATIPVGDVFVSKLRFGVMDSNSVRRLQDVLNGIAVHHHELPVTGNYLEETQHAVMAWQVHVVMEEPTSPFATGSIPGPRQALRIFARTGNHVIDDTDGADDQA